MLVEPTLWLCAIGPLALFARGLMPISVANSRSGRDLRGYEVASIITLIVAIATFVVQMSLGPLHTATLGARGVGFALYLDALTSIMFMLVAFVGMIVIRYSRNYLAGDPGQMRFLRWMCLTLAFVLMVIISGNLFQFTLAWIGTSLALQKLLLFYRDRPAAILAVRKKFVLSRLGDLCLIGACVLIFRSVHSLDYAAIFGWFDAIHAGAVYPGSAHWIAPLLVMVALLKSAQFPFHGWLLEVMETPTPVSALLHAGIINSGGFLLLRFANLIIASPGALDVLMVIGGLTALFGSVAMLTQTSVKVSLAYSTSAQMGFMLLQCGLGAFPAALLHLVAHSLYKAHAFLSSGSVIDLARASWSPSLGGRPHPLRVAGAIAIVIAATLGTATLFGATLTQEPGVFAMGAIVLLGLTHLVVNAIDERPAMDVIARVLLLVASVAVAYFGLQWGAVAMTADSLPEIRPLRGPFDLVIILTVVLGFAAVTVMQSLMPRLAEKPRWQALYAHASNGFYVNTIANRLVLRFWPALPAKPTHIQAAGKIRE